MSKDMSLSQKNGVLALYKAHPAVSFAVKNRNVHDALVERGYAVEARVPLVPRSGLKLTDAGVRYAETGAQTFHKD